MSGNDLTLKPFHPLIRQWFTSRVGTPTGSGKTLAAFLVAIDRLVSGEWEEGGIRVLYVSPLKVLNNDVQRNLITPLDEIREIFARDGEPFPGIAVATRSGDTAGRHFLMRSEYLQGKNQMVFPGARGRV